MTEIEAAVDTNLHLLRTTGAATPTDYYESFISLGQAGVIPRPVNRTRNSKRRRDS